MRKGMSLLLVFWLPAISYAVARPPVKMVPPRQLKNMVERMGGGAAQIVAKAFGLTEVAGKPLDSGGGRPGRANAKMLMDAGIGVDPIQEENEPTVAANPKNKKRLVAGSHSIGPLVPNFVGCVAYTSADNGSTWTAPVLMPMLTPDSSCSDPVVTYAADGSQVYYAYMDIKFVEDDTNFPDSITVTSHLDVVVSHSDNDGATWTGPDVALAGDPYEILFTPCGDFYCGTITEPGFDYDKPWIGTHVDKMQSNWLYVSATKFDVLSPGFDSHIAFARSGNKGGTWSSPAIMDTAACCDSPGFVVQGSRPTGGVGGEVLVAWYHSGSDGWLKGSFEIRTRRSSDHGATWDPVTIAATDNYEAPYFLGPLFFYKRWWGTMFPDVEIAPNGTAHIAYTHDPEENLLLPCEFCLPLSTTAEDGDVRYISSGGPPYTSWSSPITANDDGMVRAQGFAAMKVGEDGTVHVIWEDTRLSPDLPISDPIHCNAVFPPVEPIACDSANLYFDIFYARKVPGRAGWSKNFRVSERSSTQDFSFTGDYIDLAANATTLFGIWTDRRDRIFSVFDSEDNIFGSRIIAGGAAP